MEFHPSFLEVLFIALIVGAIAAPIYKVAEELKRMNDRFEERDNERTADGDDLPPTLEEFVVRPNAPHRRTR